MGRNAETIYGKLSYSHQSEVKGNSGANKLNLLFVISIVYRTIKECRLVQNRGGTTQCTFRVLKLEN